jgi:SsrA-binding protein
VKSLARNKKAGFNYHFLETIEAGMVLKGWQVKSIKAGNISINEAYVYIHKDEVFLKNANIADWPGMSDFDRAQKDADIKLLLHQNQIAKWLGKLQQQQATTIVPTKIYEVKGKIKAEIALAKGVKKYDKRSKIREREQKRDIERQLKQSKYF